MSTDSTPAPGSLSIHGGKSLALRRGNTLVTRGLREIGELRGAARAEEYLRRGKAYMDARQFQEAIATFTEAIRLDPRCAEAYDCRGLAHYSFFFNNFANLDSIDSVHKATADFTEAIRLNPSRADTYLRRGLFCFFSLAPDKAVADFAEAIRLNPDNAEAHCCRAEAFLTTGNWDEAIADYNEAIRLDPKDATAYHGRGKAYMKKGDRVKAKSDFAEAERLGYKP
jgi:tetratricopeptide (TPR) repeat protein